MYHVETLILYFFIYSVIGWLWETVYCSIKAKHFVYRGFLLGPYCPIYGFGIVAVLSFLEPIQGNLLLLYVSSAVLVTILEYFTSYILEKAFHATWWDYHDVPLNINGRVALPVSLFWGIGCVLIVKVIQPVVETVTKDILRQTGMIVPILIVVIMSADLIYTLVDMNAFGKLSKEWHSVMDKKRAEFPTEFPKLSATTRRHLKNFNQLKATNIGKINRQEFNQWLKQQVHHKR